jgi:hypothetical protein
MQRRGDAVRDCGEPFAPPERGFGAKSSRPEVFTYSASLDQPKEILMKALNNLAALSLSFILALAPFALIAVNDLVR